MIYQNRIGECDELVMSLISAHAHAMGQEMEPWTA